MHEKILAAMTAEAFLLQVTVGMTLVIFFCKWGSRSLVSLEGRYGGRQRVSGTMLLPLVLSCTGLFLPSCLCPELQLQTGDCIPAVCVVLSPVVRAGLFYGKDYNVLFSNRSKSSYI